MVHSLYSVLCPALVEFTSEPHGGGLKPAHQDFAPGFFLNSDPKLGLSGTFSAPKARLLELDADMASHGDWVGLHVVLPLQDLTKFSYIGFTCRTSAPKPLILRSCLRSGLPDGGFVDCFFDKHILPDERATSHVDCLYLDERTSIPLVAPWRQFILFLPCSPFRLTLMHLHPFAL